MASIDEDKWLSKVFGHAVFRVALPAPPPYPASEGPALAADVASHSRRQTRAMYYAKVDVASVDVVRQLSQAGFYVVDTNVTLAIEAARTQPEQQDARCAPYTICEATADLASLVRDMARTCFRFSRFHLDPLVPPEIANWVKHDWVHSYLCGARGERLYVAMEGERPLGFLAVLATRSQRQEERVIDLLGVAPPYQRRGVGKALVRFFIDRYKGACDILKVGTQAANVASLRLYQGCGFAVVNNSYVMHMHVGSGSDGAYSRQCA
jgi:GNAT superfamily N-acetyltransferase